MQQQLKQAGYDPGPIDGVLGPKTLAALQQYLATQERVFVQDTPSQPHPKNGKQGWNVANPISQRFYRPAASHPAAATG